MFIELNIYCIKHVVRVNTMVERWNASMMADKDFDIFSKKPFFFFTNLVE